MYGPAPSRPKKTAITRARTGCLTCRRRRKKCDEKKPTCSVCEKLGHRCEPVLPKFAFQAVSFAPRDGPSDAPSEEPSQAITHTPESVTEPSDIILLPPPAYTTPLLSIPGDMYLSMQDTRDPFQVTFYMALWDENTLPSLHPAFARFGQSSMPPVLRDAMVALSACQTSRLTPRKKQFHPDDPPGMSFRPDAVHQTVFQEVYGSALSQLATWTGCGTAAASSAALATMILFAHMQLLMGDFRQFSSHAAGVDSLLDWWASSNAWPDDLSFGLVAGWLQIRAHHWWRRFHFSTLEFRLNNDSLAAPAWLGAVSIAVSDSRVTIMTALCECCRLNSLALLEQWHATQGYPPQAGVTIETLDVQKRTLDDWHNQLADGELPIESFLDAPGDVSPSTLDVKTLRFSSHAAAMNYAYYVVSRLLLCAVPVRGSESEAASWSLLLARIAAGIDWDQCIRLNGFVVGFSGLILNCILHCPDPVTSLWLSDWLEQRYSTAALEEGSFPVLQILRVIRAVHRQRRRGLVVRAVFRDIDDGGGAGKYSSYHSQHLDSIEMLGYKTGGEMVTRSVWL